MIRTAQKAPEKQKPGPKPSDYKHIAAWGRHHGWSHQEISGSQRVAARMDAPIDAVHETLQGWATMGTVGVRTRMAIEVELNRGK